MNRIRQLLGLQGFTFKITTNNSFIAVKGDFIVSCQQDYKGYKVEVSEGVGNNLEKVTTFEHTKSMKVLQFLKSQLKGV